MQRHVETKKIYIEILQRRKKYWVGSYTTLLPIYSSSTVHMIFDPSLSLPKLLFYCIDTYLTKLGLWGFSSQSQAASSVIKIPWPLPVIY